MADLEQRVTSASPPRKRTRNIPDLIKMEFRLANSQIARLSRDVIELQRGLGDLTGKVGDLSANVEAMPRVMVELVSEMLAERDRKR